MRWNCPHCGTGLALNDDKISTGWSFSKCYKCAGHALIRKAGIQLIKVDKAPPGETLLLPEANEPAQFSNQVAARTAAPKPAVQRPTNSTQQADMAAVQKIFGKIPEPLPELPSASNSLIQKLLPAAIGLTGIAAISSGIYLYFQGQTLIERARHNIVQTRAPARAPAVRSPTQTTEPVEMTTPVSQP